MTMNATYRVAGLLGEYLCEGDHVLAVELFGEVDHRVRSVLLLTGTRSGQERRERVNGDLVALLASAGRILYRKVNG